MQKKSRVSECTENTGALAERLCLLLSIIQFTWCSYSPSSLWLQSIDLKLLYQNCKRSILTHTFANLALPECFSFSYTHRARVKQKTVRSCLVSQNETIYDCTGDITLRVTLKPSHDSSWDHKFLAYGWDASAATEIQVWQTQQNTAFAHDCCLLHDVAPSRQTLVANL